MVETTNAYWVIEDDTYGAVANHANKSGNGEVVGSNALEVLPYATTDLLISPNDELAHAEKSSQLEDLDDNDATPNDSSRSLAQSGDSSLILGNASVSHTDTSPEKSTTDATETKTLLNRLLAEVKITNADVVSVRLLPNVSLEELVQSENDSNDNATDITDSDKSSADSSSTRTQRNTTVTTTSGASSTPANAMSPSNSLARQSPQEADTALSVSSAVAWLRSYIQVSKSRSADGSDHSELGNADSNDPIEHARIAVLTAAFPQVAAISTVVANVDRLFSKFQMELADDTASASASASRYVRNVASAEELEDSLNGASVEVAGFSLSYSQWASLVSVVALSIGTFSKKSPRESRDEERLAPFRARTEFRLRVASVAE